MDNEEFFVNNNGLRMRRCCASCIHKDYTESVNYRTCKIHKVDVVPSEVCESYETDPKYMDEGGSLGQVRTKHFIDYLTERLLEPEVPGVKKPTPFSVEKEYTEKYGSPYVKL